MTSMSLLLPTNAVSVLSQHIIANCGSTQLSRDVGKLQAGQGANRKQVMGSPGADRLKKLRMLMGMLYFMAGRVVRGWSTFAPK